MTTLSPRVAGAIAAAAGVNLLPLGLVVFTCYGAVCSVLGAALRRRLEARGPAA